MASVYRFCFKFIPDQGPHQPKIYQDGDPVLHVTDKDHAVDLVGLLALLVDQGKVDVQAIRNRSHPEKKSFVNCLSNGTL